MKRTLTITAFCLFLVCVPAFAQQAEIVSVEGNVEVLKEASSEWEKAQVGVFLDKNAEIKIGSSGKCTVAFDKEKKNIVTIEKETQIKIEKILPGSVYLSKGRVFTLIRNIKQVENFEVRTPTAVAGARGTGWVTEYAEGNTEVSVFEDNVLVAGLDESGEVVSEQEVAENFQTEVLADGQQEEIQPVSEGDKQEWQGEVKVLEQFSQEFQGREQQPGQPPMGPPKMMDPLQQQAQVQRMADGMRESGKFTEQQIQEMIQKMESGFPGPGTMMPPPDMPMTPQMEAMKQEMESRMGEFQNMTPEEMRAVMQEMEQRYGIEHMGPPPGGEYGPYPPGGEGYYPPPGSEGFYPPPPGGEGYYPPQGGEYGTSPEFHDYMGEYMGPPPDGMYPEGEYMYYDPYFGEFDQTWNTEGGYYVHDPYDQYYDEYYQTIVDQPVHGCNYDSICQSEYEDNVSCSADCLPPICDNDAICDFNETHVGCPADCP